MKSRAMGLALCALLTTAALLASGCKKSGGGGGAQGIDSAAAVGTWQEVAENPNPRMQTRVNKKFLRTITINADNTFEFSVASNDGKPLDAMGKATGTWAVKDNQIAFTVSENTLSGAESDELNPPEMSGGVKNVKDKQMLQVSDTNYMMFYMEKK